MFINFDKVLGDHGKVLNLLARRSNVIASNIANTDTPGFKARDLDFKAELERIQMTSKTFLRMETSDTGHIAMSPPMYNETLVYRNVTQPSLDGNTVDTHHETVQFAENAIRYHTALRFINGKFKSMMTAIKGE